MTPNFGVMAILAAAGFGAGFVDSLADLISAHRAGVVRRTLHQLSRWAR